MEDVNARDGPGRTRLHMLCSLPHFTNRDMAELRRLLQAGADPNLVDSFERASLPLLCMNTGHLEAARALLAAGALPSSHDAWGRTSLHWCCDRGWCATAELLLRRGALVNASTKQGDSPLLWAAKSGHINLVELLLKSGCDPMLRNNRNESALDVAANDIVRTLMSSFIEENLPRSGITTNAPLLQKGEEGALTEKSLPLKEQAAPTTDKSTPTMANNNLSSHTIGSPVGGEVHTSGGLFSAYRKQPTSSTVGPGSGPGPKKMKITLKKK